MRAIGTNEKLNSRVGAVRGPEGGMIGYSGVKCSDGLCRPDPILGHPSEQCSICGKSL